MSLKLSIDENSYLHQNKESHMVNTNDFTDKYRWVKIAHGNLTFSLAEISQGRIFDEHPVSSGIDFIWANDKGCLI